MYFLAGNDAGIYTLVAIDQQTFEIRLNKNLSTSVEKCWILTVRFFNPLSDKTSYATINVFKINYNNFPTFPVSSYRVSINENTAVGTSILQVQANDVDSLVNLRYHILNDFPRRFSVNHTTGVVTVARVLDYEFTKLHSFYIQVIDTNIHPTRSASVQCIVTILDVNDNLPFFPEDIYNVTISETVVTGFHIAQIRARDLDSATFGEITYKIESGDLLNQFTITNKGDVVIASQLDFEDKTNYILLISAMDKYGYRSVNMTKLYVYLTDSNDFQPVFQLSRYEYAISEAQSVPYQIAILTAVDNDYTNNKLVYSIQDNVFVIMNNTTGALTLVAPFDYESNSFHVFSVKAMDGNGFTGFANVIIRVEPIDDNRPVFSVLQKTIAIDENVAIGTIISVVKGFDADNSSIKFQLLTPNNTFGISQQQNMGLVLLISKLDYEVKQTYELLIDIVDDSGKTALNKSMLTVNVRNIDDNPVQFDKRIFTFNVPEDTVVGNIFGVIKAYHNDSNNTIRYSIIQPPSEFLLQSNTSAFLILNTTLDFEVKKQYNFTLMATGASLESANYVTIFVVVSDVNDVPPVISGKFSYSIKENIPMNSVLFITSAFDIDTNTALLYSLSSDLNVSLPFDIGSDTGKVLINDTIDYERRQNYTFKVSVSDGIHKDMKTYVIYVIDDNDNKPTFEFQIYNITVYENLTLGSLIGKASAFDKDTGIYGTVHYRIVGAPDNLPFLVNIITGEITLMVILDFELETAYKVLLQAYDMEWTDSKSQGTISEINISVLNVDDVDPQFTQSFYIVNIVESAPYGYSVLKVTAKDADGPFDFVYSISSGNNNGTFSINATSGKIVVVGKLDFETKYKYNLTVLVQSNNKTVATNVLFTLLMFIMNNYDLRLLVMIFLLTKIVHQDFYDC